MSKRLLLGVILIALIGPQVASAPRFLLPELPRPWQYGDVVIDRLSTANGQAPVVFSHWSHRIRHSCRVCHLELEFEMKVGATEITEEKNRDGNYCGACHNGEVAFGHNDATCSRCHGGDPRGSRRRFEELDPLPKAQYGNEIDWVRAVETGQIKPRQTIGDEPFDPMPFAKRLKLEARWIMIPAAYFPHAEHQLWLDCANCHPDIFNVKKKTTEHFEMKYILDRKFCGVCHLGVAFPLNDCTRCHPDMGQ